jgi:hypothetical protein
VVAAAGGRLPLSFGACTVQGEDIGPSSAKKLVSELSGIAIKIEKKSLVNLYYSIGQVFCEDS